MSNLEGYDLQVAFNELNARLDKIEIKSEGKVTKADFLYGLITIHCDVETMNLMLKWSEKDRDVLYWESKP